MMESALVLSLITGPLAVYVLTHLYKVLVRKLKPQSPLDGPEGTAWARDMAATIVAIVVSLIVGAVQFFSLPAMATAVLADFLLKWGVSYSLATIVYKAVRLVLKRVKNNNG